MSALLKRLEKSFCRQVQSYLSRNRIEHRFSVSPHPHIPHHILIRKGLYPYITICIMDSTGFYTNPLNAQPSAEVDFFVLTDCRQVLIYDNSRAEIRHSDLFQTFFELLNLTKPSPDELEDLKKKIVTQVRLALEECRPLFSHHPAVFEAIHHLLTGRNLAQWLDYNEDGRFFHFRTQTPSVADDFEHLFFQCLLYPADGPFYHIPDRNLHLSHNRQHYVNRYLHYFETQLHPIPETWSIGLCNTVGYPIFLKNTPDGHIIIRKISYAEPTGLHPQLEMIGRITERLHAEENIRFRFLYLDTWKHFFREREQTGADSAVCAICQVWINR